MENEIWKDITGYEGLYQVSNYGGVRSVKGSKSINLKQSVNDRNYSVVGLWKHNKLKTKKVHRLVAESFLSKKTNQRIVNHKDGLKSNNDFRNLEWCNSLHNNHHALRTGLVKTKLSREDVLLIKKLNKQGIKRIDISNVFNVSRTTINNVVNGNSYHWLR
jgi:hypothetical protein